VIVLDTHALVWWVSDSARLSDHARRAIAGALRRGPLVASAISVFEISTAARRGRLALAAPVEQWLADLLSLAEVRIEPVTAAIAALAGNMPDPTPGDPADRIIAATAALLQLKLVTADDRLKRSPHIRTVW